RRIMEHDARGFEAPQWRQLADMGYVGLTVPAEKGGQGLGAVELAVVCEEAGRVCLPGPLLDAVLAADLLARARGHQALRADGCAGTRVVALARLAASFAGPADGGPRVVGGTLRGSKHFVPFAESADVLLVTAADGIHLAAAPFAVTPTPTLDLAQRFG